MSERWTNNAREYHSIGTYSLSVGTRNKFRVTSSRDRNVSTLVVIHHNHCIQRSEVYIECTMATLDFSAHNSVIFATQDVTYHDVTAGVSNLAITSNLKPKFGEITLFAPDGNVCPIPFRELELFIQPSLTLTMLLAPSAFDGVTKDITGGVLWGAGVCLARWLTEEQVKGKFILELGCGGGAPSMVASKYGAIHVVSSDFEMTTLQHMDLHIQINDCQRNMELRKLDWEHLDNNDDYKADVIIASDILYGVSKVQALVKTIDKYLSPDGSLFMATRDSRPGMEEFRELMKTLFVEINTVPCDPTHLDAQDLGSWVGAHTIHIFQRKSIYVNNTK